MIEVKEILEFTPVITAKLKLESPAPVNGTLVSIGRLYDQVGQHCNPNREVLGEQVWDNAKLFVETSKARYFGRPAIPSSRRYVHEDKGVFIDVSPSRIRDERFVRTPRALGILTVGCTFEWGSNGDEVIENILAVHSEDILAVNITDDMPDLFDDRRFIDLDEQLASMDIKKTAWSLGASYIFNSRETRF